MSCLLICVAEFVNHNRPVRMRMQTKKTAAFHDYDADMPVGKWSQCFS
jgi:hypothetical protein